ncbi:hypothetical protein [Haloferula sp. BvORR071]|uniref:lipopolysaccharide biosynthesis protein n=1 Tax=Haloferula sp. BvORR071 TaxID=1396141 RepID=UPI00055076C2|nr:hypothetical protein [Haloferula sp. BvORR071]
MISGLFHRLRSSPTGLTAAAGYAAMLSAVFVGFFNVPLALKFLSGKEFGLWNVVGQTLGYLLLLDFGVSWSASRMLVGPMREGNQKELNSWWTIIVAVLIFQGLLVAGIGLGAAKQIIGSFEDLPPDLIPAAEGLWVGMILINAIQLPFRAYTGVLYCQDRWYIMHVVTILTSWINLIAFAILLYAGFRTYAYLIASLLSVGTNSLLMQYMVRRSGVRLQLVFRGFDFEKLRVLFRYSSGVFLLALAGQIAFTSQSLILSKVIGLEAVTVFVVSYKSFTVIKEILKRAFDSFSPRWMQLYVSGDKQAVWNEWKNLMAWLLPTAMIGALGILIFNRSFSMLYGGPANHESRVFDLFTAVGLVAQVFTYFTEFVFPMSGRVKGRSIAGIIDAVLQMTSGIMLTHWYGATGLMLGALIGPVCVSIPYLLLKAPAQLGISRRTMVGAVARTYGLTLLCMAGSFFALNTPAATPDTWGLSGIECLLGVGLACLGLFWFWKFRGIFMSAKRVEA